MNKESIKKCKILYNPISTGFKKENLELIKNTIMKKGLIPEFKMSEKPGHMINLVKESDSEDTLTITLGGDGTVSEAYKAYNEIEQKGLYAHVPTGTTNDMAKNYDVRYKDADKIVEDILNGEIVTMDSYKMNNEIVAYTSVFGYLAHVPYVTDKNMKKYFKHAGYVLSAIPYIIRKPEKYKIKYETDNLSGTCDCILGAVSNSKGFAGVDLFHNASLNDGKLELILIANANPKLIASIVRDYIKNDIDLEKYKGSIITDSSSKIKLTFNTIYPKYKFDNDGEAAGKLLTYGDDSVTYEVAKPIHVLKRKKD